MKWNGGYEMARKTSHKRIFISHAAIEDSDIANAFKCWMIEVYQLHKSDVFVSSSPDSLTAEDFWTAVIGKNLRKHNIMVVLLTKASISKRWVVFEMGAGYQVETLIPPILCKGAKVSDIPSRDPLTYLQAKRATSKAEFTAVLDELDKAIGRKRDYSKDESLRRRLSKPTTKKKGRNRRKVYQGETTNGN